MPPQPSIFDAGACIVPDFITPAEEDRILLRISQSPWLTELRRRVQHYGYRYDYAGKAAPAPAPAFPRWASVMAERLREQFRGGLPDQCIVNEYRRARPSACTPTTGLSDPSWSRFPWRRTGRCGSGHAPGSPTPAARCRATRSPCCRAARFSCWPATRGTAGCTESWPLTAAASPSPGSPQPSAPSATTPTARLRSRARPGLG